MHFNQYVSDITYHILYKEKIGMLATLQLIHKTERKQYHA